MFDWDGDVPVVLRAAKNGGSFGRFETRRTQMINHETEVKLQACLDGELSPGEATTLEKLIAGDPDARSLFEELRATRTLLAGNALDLKLPDTRGFYWSKIRRKIELDEGRKPEGNGRKPVYATWGRLFTTASAMVAIVEI